MTDDDPMVLVDYIRVYETCTVIRFTNNTKACSHEPNGLGYIQEYPNMRTDRY